MGCGKNTAFQALDTLLQEGYLVRDPSGSRYQLGHLALDFIDDGSALDVRSLCREYLAKLNMLTHQSIFLSIIVGRYNVCIDSIIVPGTRVGYSPLSMPIPLHVGTGSRLLLAFLDDKQITEYIEKFSPFTKITPRTLTQPEEIWEEVHLVRSRGFARGYEDHSTGANYLAFPVFSALKRPLAAIIIGGPNDVFTHERADELIPVIQPVIDELNQHSRVFPAVPLVKF